MKIEEAEKAAQIAAQVAGQSDAQTAPQSAAQSAASGLVHSAFALPTKFRGSIYIEAPSEKDVRLAVWRFRGVKKWHPIELVSLVDAAAILDFNAGRLTLKKGSWVRVKRGFYRHDLGYVSRVKDILPEDWNEDDMECNKCYEMATIKLIPRIPPILDADQETAKRKRPTPAARPHQQFFVSDAYTDPFPKLLRTVGKQKYWEFRGDTYCDDLFELTIYSNTLNVEEIIPSKDEVALWDHCMDDDIRNALRALLRRHNSNTMEFWSGDKVRGLADSLYFGQRGVIESVVVEEAVVKFEDITQPVQAFLRDLEKYVEIGDHIKVLSGPQQGREGWVTGFSACHVSMVEYGTYEMVINSFQFCIFSNSKNLTRLK